MLSGWPKPVVFVDWDPSHAMPGGTAAITQTVTLPADADLRLTFSYNVFTNDTIYFAAFQVYVTDVGRGTSTLVLEDGNRAQTPVPYYTTGWRSKTIELSAYRAGRLQVSYQVINRFDELAYRSFGIWAYLDDISVSEARYRRFSRKYLKRARSRSLE